MSQSVKVYEGAYLSTDKKTAISGLEELYSYLMTKFLKEYNVGTSLTQLYKDVTAFLKEEAGSDKSQNLLKITLICNMILFLMHSN